MIVGVVSTLHIYTRLSTRKTMQYLIESNRVVLQRQVIENNKAAKRERKRENGTYTERLHFKDAKLRAQYQTQKSYNKVNHGQQSSKVETISLKHPFVGKNDGYRRNHIASNE